MTLSAISANVASAVLSGEEAKTMRTLGVKELLKKHRRVDCSLQFAAYNLVDLIDGGLQCQLARPLITYSYTIRQVKS